MSTITEAVADYRRLRFERSMAKHQGGPCLKGARCPNSDEPLCCVKPSKSFGMCKAACANGETPDVARNYQAEVVSAIKCPTVVSGQQCLEPTVCCVKPSEQDGEGECLPSLLCHYSTGDAFTQLDKRRSKLTYCKSLDVEPTFKCASCCVKQISDFRTGEALCSTTLTCGSRFDEAGYTLRDPSRSEKEIIKASVRSELTKFSQVTDIPTGVAAVEEYFQKVSSQPTCDTSDFNQVLTPLLNVVQKLNPEAGKPLWSRVWETAELGAICAAFFTNASVPLLVRSCVWSEQRVFGSMVLHNAAVVHLSKLTVGKPEALTAYHTFLVDMAESQLTAYHKLDSGNSASFVKYLKEHTEIGLYYMFDQQTSEVVTKEFPILKHHPHSFGLFMVYPFDATTMDVDGMEAELKDFFFAEAPIKVPPATVRMELFGGAGHARNIYLRFRTSDPQHSVTTANKGVGLDCLRKYDEENTLGRRTFVVAACALSRVGNKLPMSNRNDKHLGYQDSGDSRAEMSNLDNKYTLAKSFNANHDTSSGFYGRPLVVMELHKDYSRRTVPADVVHKNVPQVMAQMSYFSPAETNMRVPMSPGSDVRMNWCGLDTYKEFKDGPINSDLYRTKRFHKNETCRACLVENYDTMDLPKRPGKVQLDGVGIIVNPDHLAKISDKTGANVKCWHECLPPKWGTTPFMFVVPRGDGSKVDRLSGAKWLHNVDYTPKWYVAGFDFDAEAEEWNYALTRVPVQVPTAAITTGDALVTMRQRNAFVLLRNLFVAVAVFIKDSDSSGKAGDSFRSRNFGVTVRDADEWGKGILRFTPNGQTFSAGSFFSKDLGSGVELIDMILGGFLIDCATSRLTPLFNTARELLIAMVETGMNNPATTLEAKGSVLSVVDDASACVDDSTNKFKKAVCVVKAAHKEDIETYNKAFTGGRDKDGLTPLYKPGRYGLASFLAAVVNEVFIPALRAQGIADIGGTLIADILATGKVEELRKENE